MAGRVGLPGLGALPRPPRVSRAHRMPRHFPASMTGRESHPFQTTQNDARARRALRQDRLLVSVGQTFTDLAPKSYTLPVDGVQRLDAEAILRCSEIVRESNYV